MFVASDANAHLDLVVAAAFRLDRDFECEFSFADIPGELFQIGHGDAEGHGLG